MAESRKCESLQATQRHVGLILKAGSFAFQEDHIGYTRKTKHKKQKTQPRREQEWRQRGREWATEADIDGEMMVS